MTIQKGNTCEYSKEEYLCKYNSFTYYLVLHSLKIVRVEWLFYELTTNN